MSYHGVVQHVALDSGRMWREEIDRDTLSRYLGGRGVGARLLWDNTKAGTDPRGSDNVIIFSAGALSGTNAPSSGRTTLQGKSPTTGRYLRSSAGGDFAAALKFAGYDHLVVHGRSEKPVNLVLRPEGPEIRSAAKMWGADVRQTHALIQADLAGPAEWSTACIGPAGERLVAFASVMVSVYNALARAGTGTLFGAKNLKAVAVGGDGPVRVADPRRFRVAVEKARMAMQAVKGGRQWLNGTAGGVKGLNDLGVLPSYNFQRGRVADPKPIDGQTLTDEGYLKRRVACFSCPIGCHRYTEISAGALAGSYAGGPEYETVDALGAGCGLLDTAAVLRANELCNIYGLDTISAGGAIQWLMECAERGAVPETMDGLSLRWGEAETVIELVRKMAFREGVGDLLARGLAKAAQEVGHDSYKWAVEVNGLEQSRVDIRGSKGCALAFATNPRGPDHLHSAPIAELGVRPDQRWLVGRITGDENYARPNMMEKRVELVRWHEDWRAVGDCLGMCFFATTSNPYILPELMAELFSAATGVEKDVDAMALGGRRIATLERCFNVRDGASRAQDTLPWRMMNEESPDLPGLRNSREELDSLLDGFYAAHGWDRASGRPTAECLARLELEDVAGQLKRLGMLPSQ